MKELEDPESIRDFKTISRRVSDVRKRVSESGFERADALRVRVFTWGSSMQSSGHAESQGLLSLFSIHAGRRGFVLIRLGHLGFGRNRAGFWTVLGDMSSGATKEAKLVVKTVLKFLCS